MIDDNRITFSGLQSELSHLRKTTHSTLKEAKELRMLVEKMKSMISEKNHVIKNELKEKNEWKHAAKAYERLSLKISRLHGINKEFLLDELSTCAIECSTEDNSFKQTDIFLMALERLSKASPEEAKKI